MGAGRCAISLWLLFILLPLLLLILSFFIALLSMMPHTLALLPISSTGPLRRRPNKSKFIRRTILKNSTRMCPLSGSVNRVDSHSYRESQMHYRNENCYPLILSTTATTIKAISFSPQRDLSTLFVVASIPPSHRNEIISHGTDSEKIILRCSCGTCLKSRSSFFTKLSTAL